MDPQYGEPLYLYPKSVAIIYGTYIASLLGYRQRGSPIWGTRWISNLENLSIQTLKVRLYIYLILQSHFQGLDREVPHIGDPSSSPIWGTSLSIFKRLVPLSGELLQQQQFPFLSVPLFSYPGHFRIPTKLAFHVYIDIFNASSQTIETIEYFSGKSQVRFPRVRFL